jgi:hypothetical protein
MKKIRTSLWRTIRTISVTISPVIALLGMAFSLQSAEARPASDPVATGVISGSVTTDQGEVRAFRVRAKDTVHLFTYTVFTNKSKYHIYNLPPSTYEVQVRETEFDSRAQVVELSSEEMKTADLALKATPPVTSDVKLLEYDQLYPPGPVRSILEKNCFGCHGYQEGGLYPYHPMSGKTEGEWAAAMVKSTFPF